MTLLILAAGGVGFAAGHFGLIDQLVSGDGDGSTDMVERLADPDTGCDAIAAGIRALLASGSYSEPVKAQLLDGLLLNYRNMECGITNRTRLFLDLVHQPNTPSP
jgi:hypothetical protein